MVENFKQLKRKAFYFAIAKSLIIGIAVGAFTVGLVMLSCRLCGVGLWALWYVLMGDIKKKGKLFSMLSEIVKPGTLENIIIKAQHNCFSDNTQYSGSFIPILHEYVMIVRKDNSVVTY